MILRLTLFITSYIEREGVEIEWGDGEKRMKRCWSGNIISNITLSLSSLSRLLLNAT